MDLEALGIFVKVADLQSFTRAAEQLGISKARVSLRVKALEAQAGVRLLLRTTRTVRLTPDGEQFLARARRLVTEAEELGAMFSAPSALAGRVRLDLPVVLARDVIIRHLPELLAAHPALEILVSATDRRVDVLREGFDLVLRVGALADSGLSVRRLGVLPMTNYVSRRYVQMYGTPRTLEELDRHLLVNYSPDLGADPPELEYREGGRLRTRRMKSLVTVNNADAYLAACLAGLGIIQVPRNARRARATKGELVPILPQLTPPPMPVSLVHGHGKNVPRRVRAVMTWLETTLASEVEHA